MLEYSADTQYLIFELTADIWDDIYFDCLRMNTPSDLFPIAYALRATAITMGIT